MTKIISYPISVIYGLCFFLCLIFFHPVQWIALNVFGYDTHRRTVYIMNWFLMRCTNILGTRYSYKNPYTIPTDKPIIFVSNHQSLYDIPPIIWYLRKHHPKFISKIELAKGIPSVSYNLRHGGSALIDRKNPEQAIPAIKKFGQYLEENKRSAVIFPEGTRSKTGIPRKFQTKGLKVLIESMPSALVVPITINNSWKMQKYGKFPMGLGSHIKFNIHKPLPVDGYPIEELLEMVEKNIKNDIVI